MVSLSEIPGRSLSDYATEGAKMRNFNPYADNGG